MVKTHTQKSATQAMMHDVCATFRHFAAGMVGRQHVAAEVKTAAAHFDGLVDIIERTGWDIEQLEQIRHAFDDTAEKLLRELVESSPEMSEQEQRSYLAPFRDALHQFAHLSRYERGQLRAEYGRFAQLHAQVLQSFATEESA